MRSRSSGALKNFTDNLHLDFRYVRRRSLVEQCHGYSDFNQLREILSDNRICIYPYIKVRICQWLAITRSASRYDDLLSECLFFLTFLITIDTLTDCFHHLMHEFDLMLGTCISE